MLFILLNHLKPLYFFEFFLQVAVFYNFFQLLRQRNFYYLLSYFFFTVLFLGIILIFYDFDMPCFILWLVYISTIAVFFLYSLAWLENIKDFYFFFKARLFNYILIFFFSFFLYLLNTDFSREFLVLNVNLIDYYKLLGFDILEELEITGWGLLYYTSFLFLIISYFFFFVCCSIILILLNARYIKDINIFYFLFFLKKFEKTNFFSFFKNQYFFIQEYDNIFQNFTFMKHFRITGMFHKISR